jgi:hypothetical protein
VCLTDVPAAANLPRLLGKSQRLHACAFNPQFGVIESLHSFREVSMPENQEVLRQALLTDLAGLRENLDKTWTIVLTLPIGASRTNLELTHQSSSQLVLNMKKTLMEMV